MILYHGSNTANIKILKPNQADHDRPYVYMTTMDVVAAFYLCNAVERPYYWFPYGFESGSDQVIPFKNIPCARLATEPIEVTNCIRVENAYDRKS